MVFSTGLRAARRGDEAAMEVAVEEEDVVVETTELQRRQGNGLGRSTAHGPKPEAGLGLLRLGVRRAIPLAAHSLTLALALAEVIMAGPRTPTPLMCFKLHEKGDRTTAAAGEKEGT